jgi:hypothetical protein
MLAHTRLHAQPLAELPLLPSPIIERLAAEGIDSLEAWRRLGRKRLRIFGITRRVVAQLDALAERGAA